MSESIPSSITSFAHRRTRANSTTSFTYFQESEQPEEWNADEAVIDESEDEAGSGAWPEDDLESNQPRSSRQGSSGSSRISAENTLLRQDSSKTGSSGYGHGGRVSQKIYILTEDLTIVVAGFRTSVAGFAIYVFLCGITLGLSYLLLRWLPRWRVRLIGSPTPLRECSWVVIEVSSSLAHLILEIPSKFGRTNGASSPFRMSPINSMAKPYRPSLVPMRKGDRGITMMTTTL